MKKSLLSILIILFIASCSKKDDVDPNLATQVEGTYKVSSVNNITFPQNGVSMELKLSRIDDVTVNYLIILYQSGKIVEQADAQAILSKSGDRILLKEGGKEVGYVEGKTFIIDFVDDGERTYIIASK